MKAKVRPVIVVPMFEHQRPLTIDEERETVLAVVEQMSLHLRLNTLLGQEMMAAMI